MAKNINYCGHYGSFFQMCNCINFGYRLLFIRLTPTFAVSLCVVNSDLFAALGIQHEYKAIKYQLL